MDHDRVWAIEGSDGPETRPRGGGVNQCNHEISEVGESKGRHVAFQEQGELGRGWCGWRVARGVREFRIYRFDIPRTLRGSL